MNRVFPLTALMAGMGFLMLAQHPATSQPSTSRPVTSRMLLDGLKDPAQWLMFGGDYTSRRNSPLTQLTPRNVSQLTPQWLFQTPAPAPGRGFESTPVVLDGVMYVTGNFNHAWALDARTGRQIWHYQRTLPDRLRVCCGMVNRGPAVLGDKLYMGTLDAHLVALDRKTGNVVWDATVEEPKKWLFRYPCPARCQEQGDRRRFGRRLRDPWLHRRLRRRNRDPRLALLHHSWCW